MSNALPTAHLHKNHSGNLHADPLFGLLLATEIIFWDFFVFSLIYFLQNGFYLIYYRLKNSNSPDVIRDCGLFLMAFLVFSESSAFTCTIKFSAWTSILQLGG